MRHQAEAYAAARAGGNLIVTTGTASGKTLAFNLPVLDALAADPHARALYLYPTKALAQDQARTLAALAVPGVRPAIYDGDTPTERRRQIRGFANLILTNPDMLHIGVLPRHDLWGDVLHNLRFVVVDEAHVYRGVFGSHVANVLRRLHRLARIYGAEPQFLLASATIANPGELAHALLGTRGDRRRRRRGPARERTIALWNPPLLDADLGIRASALGEAARLLAELAGRGLRTICFAKSRKSAELIHRFAADRLPPETAARLAPYRAGYTPQQRREIERRLVEGELLGVTSTDALELGIDIGQLDCAISVGFPGTMASLRQQWGRAGRRGHGLAVLVASEDALDQYFMREPETLLGRRVEAAILDYANPRVLDGHVAAAAFEAPVDDADRATLGDDALERAPYVPELRETPRGWVVGREGLARRAHAAPLHFGGRVHRDRRLDGRAPRARRGGTRVLDRPRRVRSTSTSASRTSCASSTSRRTGRSSSRSAATGTRRPARRRRPRSSGHCGSSGGSASSSRSESSRSPSVSSPTSGSPRGTAPRSRRCRSSCRRRRSRRRPSGSSPRPHQLEGLEAMPLLLSSLHAAEHSLIALLPLWAMCDRWDIGGLSTNDHPDTGGPTVFVYDGHAGGVGIAERGFDRFEGWVADTAKMLTGCPCERGCPSCVQSPKCGNLNELLDKGGALTLLRRLLAA